MPRVGEGGCTGQCLCMYGQIVHMQLAQRLENKLSSGELGRPLCYLHGGPHW